MPDKPNDETPIRTLYQSILDAWNRRNAAEYAALVAEDGDLIGFDGSTMKGSSEVEAELSRIFADHQTAAYVGIVRRVRFLEPEVAVLHAVAGMVQPGKSDINPPTNAIQMLVAERRDGQWRAAVFQNTPAAFHGRPELSEKLTEELRQALRSVRP
ncbi:MAG TPA: SgcJ/EcaC family oxidoreductase [Thermoanaerobaculia bacterium]|nr:SgcJ/EcaC family oxidoreductase [Thermoanaerobaculia bacterium]